MRCPKCGAELELGELQGIEVSGCRGCAGIWLAAGTLETIVRRTLAANAELAANSTPTAESVRGGRERANSFLNQINWRSLKLRIMTAFLVASSGLLAVAAYGDEPKAYRIELKKAAIGTVEVPAGRYTMLIHRDGADRSVRLTDAHSGNVIDVAAKVESGGAQFGFTEIHTRSVQDAQEQKSGSVAAC